MATLKNTCINDTGYLKLPVGTTAQRPSSPQAGYMRYNTSTSSYEAYDGSAWKKIDYQSEIITSGLILHLDAGNTSSYPGGGTTWTDLSGNGNSVTLTNGPTYNSANGGSIVFDGSNDYALKSNFLNSPSNIITIACWVKFSSNTTERFVLSLGRDAGTGGGLALFAYGFSGILSYQLFFEFGSGYGRVSSGIVPSLNTWYYIAATADSSNTRFYVNGVLKNTASQGGGQIDSLKSLSVGSYLNENRVPGFYFHHGNVAQMTIYNRSLTSSEINYNYDSLKARFGL